MTDHAPFEVRIEQRAAGHLDPAAAAALEEHLASCPACRRYAGLVERTSLGLRSTQPVEWSGVEARLRAVLAARRRSIPRMAAALVVLVPVIGWAAGPEAGVGGVVLGAAILLLAVVERRRRVSEVLAAGEGTDDLIAVYRDELERRARRLRRTVLVEFSMGVFLCTLVAVAGHMPPRLLLFNGAWGVFLLVSGILHATVSRSRLAAERDAIDPGVR